jgi:hypothetical protein
LYEGTLLNFMAFLASLPIAVLVYSTITYIFLCRRQRNHI